VHLKTKTMLPSINLQVPNNIKNKMAKGLEEMKRKREELKGRGRKKKWGHKESKMGGQEKKERNGRQLVGIMPRRFSDVSH
jgi:hypothetical protein